jgi:hypothetical protein
MKNNKIQKQLRKYYQKIITVKKGCQNAKKWSKIGWGGLKIQRLKFDSIFIDSWEPCWQRKFNLRKKSPKSDVYGLN